MQRGVVKWFDETKGYGYIEGVNGEEIFVHFTKIDQKQDFKTLTPGAVVEYEAVIGELGPKAIYVREIALKTRGSE
ncbi:MAG: cold shock domain-containing protein [Calditrichaeota bacterium]|nr:cold shock domain-containing protein [Calditrichota bacterium]